MYIATSLLFGEWSGNRFLCVPPQTQSSLQGICRSGVVAYSCNPSDSETLWCECEAVWQILVVKHLGDTCSVYSWNLQEREPGWRKGAAEVGSSDLLLGLRLSLFPWGVDRQLPHALGYSCFSPCLPHHDAHYSFKPQNKVNPPSLGLLLSSIWLEKREK